MRLRESRGGLALVLVLLAAGCLPGAEDEPVASFADAVIGGEAEPDPYGFPLAADVKNAMVAVTTFGQPHCSGTVIGDRLVVSAGHCFVENSQAWLNGAPPEPWSAEHVAELEVRVGANIKEPECVLGVAEAILNPELALRDLDTEVGHANPHDSAMLVLEASVSETCPNVWPARVRLQPLTDDMIGTEGLQGGFGATSGIGVPTNYERRWSHFTFETFYELDVEVSPLGGSAVSHGDSGSGVLVPTEDGGVETVAAVSNVFRHARLDTDAEWMMSTFTDGRLCGSATAAGSCNGDWLVTCVPENGFARTDCREVGLPCFEGEEGATCGCVCDPCDPDCGCAIEGCGGEPEGDPPAQAPGESEGCAMRGATGGGEAPLVVFALALLVARRRRTPMAPDA